MSFFANIEKVVERGFRRWTSKVFGESASDDLLLVHRAIMEQVQSRIDTSQRAAPLFAYNFISVRLSSTNEHRRAMYIAAFAQESRLEDDIRQFLSSAGCSIPRGFTVQIEVSDEDDSAPQVHFEQRAALPQQSQPSQPARLIVIGGNAEQPSYELVKPRTNLGRLAVLLDRDQRPVRRNDIFFEEDGSEINGTVSRAHAHIRHDLESGEYRICDDGSEYGTRIFRDGRAIEVPPQNARGERLRPGDEIYLGRACMRFESE